MALFIPRTPGEVLRDLLAKVVGRTELSDVNVGSTMHTLLNAVAHEVSASEARVFQFRKSYALQEAVGNDLDARVAELPPIGIQRKKPTNSSGSVLTIKRLDATEELLIPAGAACTRSSDGVTYETTQDIVMQIGELQLDNVYIVCQTVGASGNCIIGAINTNVSFPADIDEITNSQPITNGIDRETDESLRARALRYVNSLGRTTKSSLEFLALSFISSDNTSFPFAKVYEDPTQPGYCELIVDDGSGMQNLPSYRAQDRIVSIPEGGSRFISHERPAIRPVRLRDITVTDSDNNDVVIHENDFISMPERGLVYFRDGVLPAGGRINIRNIRTYDGIIKELQEEIEGNVVNGEQLTGWRAAGTRVRVLPPTVDDLNIDISIIVRPEYNFDIVSKQVKDAAITFINRTSIGEPLLVSKLIANLIRTQTIDACAIFAGGTSTPLDNVYTSSAKAVIRLSSNNITVKSSI